ncbi:DUF4136 domain-containing protein [Gramella sp. GC03-9]|uniref:DUF4136 domain-containing protein n=1 Tax=Christiangramia oceanisediminis TaxID=2920386 RepID=A0A9X2KZA8_9FLAO|nr:DUF4136 domain-containing protein [Gramella oceanisediminis]MCP9201133.1 DUF4136 domain-containing protein [Gramella oceanisediminis]
MKHFTTGILMVLLSSILFSCGSGGPSAKDDARKLKAYDSYAFLPNKDTIISRDLDNDAIQGIIVETIQANMQDEGYVLDKRQPDVLVHAHVMFDEMHTVNANPVYTNYPYYRPGFYVGPYYEDNIYENYFTVQRIDGPRVSQVPYKQRTIVIDFIDRRTSQILWRGAIDEQIATRRMEREIRDYVDEIFKDFP